MEDSGLRIAVFDMICDILGPDAAFSLILGLRPPGYLVFLLSKSYTV